LQREDRGPLSDRQVDPVQHRTVNHHQDERCRRREQEHECDTLARQRQRRVHTGLEDRKKPTIVATITR
jgi:hypothetical protein